MSTLPESIAGEAAKNFHLETIAQSAADKNKETKRWSAQRITVDFISIPENTRQLFIDVMTLIHLLSGKQPYFIIPDPLSRRRLVMDPIMFAKMSILVEAVSDLFKKLRKNGKCGFQLKRTNDSSKDTEQFSIICVEIENTDNEQKRGVYNVQEALREVCDLSTSAPSVAEQLR